jgi:hypothetical protein
MLLKLVAEGCFSAIAASFNQYIDSFHDVPHLLSKSYIYREKSSTTLHLLLFVDLFNLLP